MSSIADVPFRGLVSRLLATRASGGQAASGPSGDTFRQLVESLPVAIYTTDAEGVITFFNQAAADLWGRCPVIGKEKWCGSWRLYWLDGTPMPHDQCPMATAIKTRVVPSGQDAIAERPDGSTYSFMPHPTLLFDATGTLSGAVNLLIDTTATRPGEEALRRLAAIVQTSDDAIISKDLNGIVTSWNAGAERIFGYREDEIVGRSVLLLIPPERHSEEPAILERLRKGERIEHFETVRRHKAGHNIEISLTVSPVMDAQGTVIGASKIARDVTSRKRAEEMLQRQTRRLAILNRVSNAISRDLDLERIVQSVTDIATELSGAQFGAFFYGTTDERGKTQLARALSGTPREALEKLPAMASLFEITLPGGHVVRSADLGGDPRRGDKSGEHPPTVSYLAVPVVSSSGGVVGGLFFGHCEKDAFQKETESLIAAVAAQAAVALDNARLHRATQVEIVQRRRAENAKELLLHEIKHRVKNTLGTVQAIASQTFRGGPREERDAFIARLHALSAAHDLLTQQNWDTVSFGEIVQRALAPFQEKQRQRVTAGGPDVEIKANTALLLSMVFHELGTNAVKYGALSGDTGDVALSWTLGGETTPLLTLEWRERGGPAVAAPARKGFGTQMIGRALQGEQGSASFAFDPEGLVCRIEIAI